MEDLRGQTAKANNLRPEDFVESSFVRELGKSGFLTAYTDNCTRQHRQSAFYATIRCLSRPASVCLERKDPGV